MQAMIIYDSVYGNTEEIAKAIRNAIKIQMDTKIVRVNSVNLSELIGLKLLIIGSPTHGGSPTEAIQDFLNQIPEASMKDINVAAFDTRLSTRLVKIFGYAAGKIADNLRKKNGRLIISPEAFFVKGRKGPLKEGELERANAWADDILKNYSV